MNSSLRHSRELVYGKLKESDSNRIFAGFSDIRDVDLVALLGSVSFLGTATLCFVVVMIVLIRRRLYDFRVSDLALTQKNVTFSCTCRTALGGFTACSSR